MDALRQKMDKEHDAKGTYSISGVQHKDSGLIYMSCMRRKSHRAVHGSPEPVVMEGLAVVRVPWPEMAGEHEDLRIATSPLPATSF